MGALINKNTFEEERLFERGGGGVGMIMYNTDFEKKENKI